MQCCVCLELSSTDNRLRWPEEEKDDIYQCECYCRYCYNVGVEQRSGSERRDASSSIVSSAKLRRDVSTSS